MKVRYINNGIFDVDIGKGIMSNWITTVICTKRSFSRQLYLITSYSEIHEPEMIGSKT